MKVILNNNKKEIVIGLTITILIISFTEPSLLTWITSVIDKHEGSTVAIITILGWFLAYGFTIKAQNRNFLNQIENDVRIRVNKAIDGYTNWLMSIINKIITENISSVDPVSDAEAWLSMVSQYKELFFKKNAESEWLYLLEEYESLFPETANLRIELHYRDMEIKAFLHWVFNAITEFEIDKRTAALERAKEYTDILLNQILLMQDLRIYLQNKCLTHLTGNKVPERKSKDSSSPKIVVGRNGLLEINEKEHIKYKSWIKDIGSTNFGSVIMRIKEESSQQSQ